jgi:hypothetical protein
LLADYISKNSAGFFFFGKVDYKDAPEMGYWSNEIVKNQIHLKFTRWSYFAHNVEYYFINSRGRVHSSIYGKK